MPVVLCIQFLRQTAADLVEDQSNQRFRPADVGGRHDEIECRRAAVLDEIGDAPIASARHFRDHRIAVETEERHGGREHAGPFVLAFVQKLARG